MRVDKKINNNRWRVIDGQYEYVVDRARSGNLCIYVRSHVQDTIQTLVWETGVPTAQALAAAATEVLTVTSCLAAGRSSWVVDDDGDGIKDLLGWLSKPVAQVPTAEYNAVKAVFVTYEGSADARTRLAAYPAAAQLGRRVSRFIARIQDAIQTIVEFEQ